MNPILTRLEEGKDAHWIEKFGEWWLLAGGSLNRLWKERKYSKILDLANHLPRTGFRVGFSKGAEYYKKELETQLVANRIAVEALEDINKCARCEKCFNESANALAKMRLKG